MTTHDPCAPFFALLSLCLACAPGDAGPQDISSDESGAAASTTEAPDDTTHGHSGSLTAGSDSGSDGGTASASSEGSDSSNGSSAGGGDTTSFGDYELTRGDATITPARCAVDRGQDMPWTITLDAPTGDDGSFVLHESYGPYSGLFDCTQGPDDGFACTRSFVVDYAAMGGPDARVQLDSSYLGAWSSATAIAGSYDATFTCSGTACDDATDDWNVTAFPCDIAVAFTGTASGSGGA
ncbi:MAG: hypothetical protein IPK74_28090 [Deltaproteobacteria bacterium]|nr:hypothetical protein [Deltaproteobacteria bacterium]